MRCIPSSGPNFVGWRNNLRHHQSSPLLTIDYLGTLSASFFSTVRLYIRSLPACNSPSPPDSKDGALSYKRRRRIKSNKVRRKIAKQKEEQKKRRETRKNNLEVLTQYFIPHPEFSQSPLLVLPNMSGSGYNYNYSGQQPPYQQQQPGYPPYVQHPQ